MAAAAARGFLWILVACGPIAIALWALTPAATPTRSAPGPAPTGQVGLAVGEAAESGVVAWLTTPRSEAADLRTWFPGVGDDVQLPDAPAAVSQVSIAAATPDPQQPGIWSVLVGADVLAAGEKRQVRRYFHMAVAYAASPAGGGSDPAHVTLLTLPAPVSGPIYAPSDTASAYPQQLTPSSPVGQTVEAFVSALTAGQGDITRLTSPNSAIRAVEPPTATNVRLTSLATDHPIADDVVASAPEATRLRILATTDLLDTTNQAHSTQYALTLTARAGRWEVSQIDPAPAATSAFPTPSPASAGPPKETP